jgi:hypothetical protein
MSEKEKYFEKTTSQSAITLTWYRLLDIESMFAQYVWMQLPLFDLNQLGIGLLFQMLPIEFQPFTIDFEYLAPDMDELMQGIWANFNKIDYSIEFPWMKNWESSIKTMFEPEFWTIVNKKARYGSAKFYGFFYDPTLQRDYIAQTYHKLRLLRKPDVSWKTALEALSKAVDISDIVNQVVVSRYTLMASAQDESFCLGLGILGRSKLNGTVENGAKIPYVDPEGNLIEVTYYTLENLQFGFILGVTPLGYGILTPKTPMYKMEDGKKNPEIIRIVMNKTRGVINRLTLSTWAYTNYNKPEEMVNFHKNAKADQYGMLQSHRWAIEEWVVNNLPESESMNKVMVRQYQNAVLQAICWKAKRHKWGFKPFEETPEEQYKDWWLGHWEALGCKREVLEMLYKGLEKWVDAYRDLKVGIGESIKKIRRMQAFSPYP